MFVVFAHLGDVPSILFYEPAIHGPLFLPTFLTHPPLDTSHAQSSLYLNLFSFSLPYCLDSSHPPSHNLPPSLTPASCLLTSSFLAPSFISCTSHLSPRFSSDPQLYMVHALISSISSPASLCLPSISSPEQALRAFPQ